MTRDVHSHKACHPINGDWREPGGTSRRGTGPDISLTVDNTQMHRHRHGAEG